jgi:predicted PurR-regulated permease PerM
VLGEARERLKRTDTSLLTATLILAALYFARAVFIPLALAGLLAFLLTPAARWLERRGARRTPAGLLVIFVALAGTAALGWVTPGRASYAEPEVLTATHMKCRTISFLLNSQNIILYS